VRVRTAALALVALATAATAGSAARADDTDDPGPLLGLTDTGAARSPQELLETPLSVSVVTREELRARPASDLAEALDLVPGVFAQSSRNYAQDNRISIRGFGARAQFGVRGIKILVDGIPTTLADGQSELDSIDLAFVERIEVVRGLASSLYGGGAGGIISIQTLAPTPEPRVSLRTLVGSDHLFRNQGTATGTLGGVGYVVGVSHTRYSGYREHARAEQLNLLTKLTTTLDDGTGLELSFSNVSAPEAQDPGGLTRSQVRDDREQARTRNRTLQAGERLDQQKVGLRVRRPFGPERSLTATGYWLDRDFRNALPILPAFGSGRIRFNRTAFGGSLVWDQRWRALHFTGGVDADAQRDHRRRFDNVGGAYGPKRLDQSERVRAIGGFGQLDVELGGGLRLIGGARYDWTELSIGDRLVNVPSNSTRIRWRELSPRIGLHFSRSRALQLYANWATAFRVPTTTELDAVGGGLDERIDPERSAGFEAGAKGLVGERLFYDVALFDLRVRDALIPFEVGGDTFFRNAGEVRRRGVELALSALLHPRVTLRASYTYADYRYHDYDFVDVSGMSVEELDGKREPNVPRHLVGAELRYEHPTGVYAVLALRHFSDLEANDENSAESAGATTSDLRVGSVWRRGSLEILPFAGVRNWSGAEFDGSLRPNATGGRYHEPAPETELYAGVELRY
jgi:iron complex outermembrane receptor protein